MHKTTRAKFLGSNKLFCFISISMFDSLKNPFETITSLSELYSRVRRFVQLIQTKELVSLSYGSSTSNWKPWRSMRLNLIFTMMDIIINSILDPLIKFSTSRRSTKFKGTVSWNNSQLITKTSLFSIRIVTSCLGISFLSSNKDQYNWDNMIRVFKWKQNYWRANTSFRRDK